MKGADRNKPCHCGSGVKSKRCPCGGAVARIVKHDHPALHVVSGHVREGDDLSFIKTMRLACRGSRNGVGLAANQIGVTKRAVFIYADRINELVMLNPFIAWKSDTVRNETEGCLSFPGVNCLVLRHDEIKVEWQDEKFMRRVEHFSGWIARVIQHEIDHIDGICKVGDEWAALKAKQDKSAVAFSAVVAAVGGVA